MNREAPRPTADIVVSAPAIEPYLDLGALPEGLTVVGAAGSSTQELERAMRDARAIVAIHIPAETLAAARRLEFIQVPAAGMDGILFDDLPPGTMVANTGHHGRSIGEYAMMAMVLLGRRLLAFDHALRQGIWQPPYVPTEEEFQPAATLEGQTVLLLGLGEIGSEVARLASVFGMRVLAIRRHPQRNDPPPGVAAVADLSALHDMLEEADHVVVALPLTPDTTGLIGAEEFGHMKPTAIVINVARGPIIDPESLYDALREESIGGAAIDVWYHYPHDATPVRPADPPFESLDNVLMTPHVSGVTVNTFTARAVEIAENLRRFFQGERPRNVVWPRHPSE